MNKYKFNAYVYFILMGFAMFIAFIAPKEHALELMIISLISLTIFNYYNDKAANK